MAASMTIWQLSHTDELIFSPTRLRLRKNTLGLNRPSLGVDRPSLGLNTPSVPPPALPCSAGKSPRPPPSEMHPLPSEMRPRRLKRERNATIRKDGAKSPPFFSAPPHSGKTRQVALVTLTDRKAVNIDIFFSKNLYKRKTNAYLCTKFWHGLCVCFFVNTRTSAFFSPTKSIATSKNRLRQHNMRQAGLKQQKQIFNSLNHSCYEKINDCTRLCRSWHHNGYGTRN